jgi:Family of unknown function (DUF6655)
MQERFHSMRFARAAVTVLGCSILVGCTSVKMTGTPRSGTEQLLLTGAWDSALCSVDFRPLGGRRAWLDSGYVSVVDKDWVLSSVRRTMLEQGVLLCGKKEDAQVVVELALGAYGTDERDCKAGLPQLGVVPTMFGTPAVTGASSNSALTLSETNKQDAVVKAALFAYDAKSGQMVWESGTITNVEALRDHFIMGTGPERRSSLPEVEQYPAEARSRLRERFWNWLGWHGETGGKTQR